MGYIEPIERDDDSEAELSIRVTPNYVLKDNEGDAPLEGDDTIIIAGHTEGGVSDSPTGLRFAIFRKSEISLEKYETLKSRLIRPEDPMNYFKELEEEEFVRFVMSDKDIWQNHKDFEMPEEGDTT